jgi:acyl-coenzyme A thioesterase PaaI-like protein
MFLAFFDHAIGLVASEAGNVARQVTIQLNTMFLKGAASGQFVEIESEVVSQSRSYMFMRAICRCGAVKLATADGIWKKLHAG